ncbi:hypothetical protein [Corynebacterium cystitidis]|uniref:Low molecular weight antigen MTB12-like C-terminal domain-containing protein n=1 Tax=Corynebacterium cystitidis DSM 20524 TaxID=1121357 RepID=A0A1H9NS06_9CORY|nr:hypothetical protein [Corynebacterium cystitidis]WJY82765.1 hypothetical protein CCYS_09255 [Corynebacterium cystitidis DSM 20524]SER38419.1 hypothetical protein SAMN05661109_00066 [Corynebacterium cystitidis DSM 20524]SNV70806.1 putative secreted protein [Corynebacterium cystitidis]
MKLNKICAIVATVGMAVGMVACSGDKTENGEATGAETVASNAAEDAAAQESPAPELPSAAELNEVLSRATNPELPMEERVKTVQGGETAPELFDTMTLSKQESGANFQVVDPVLPGYSANSVLATVNFTQPDQPTQLAENVEFVYENGTWKLSQSWACTLITNTVTPDQVPAMCHAGAPAPEDPAAPAQPPAAPAQPPAAPAQPPAAPAQPPAAPAQPPAAPAQ